MKGRNRTLVMAVGITSILIFVATCLTLFGFYLDDLEEDAERERLFKEYVEYKITLYESENETYDDFEVDVAFLGDSLTDGCDISRYYPDVVAVNRGIGGDTTFGLEERMGVSLYDLKPKVAVILIGGNNLYSMLDNYEELILGIKDNSPRTEILICSLTSMGMDWGHKNQIAAYNNVFLERLAMKHDCAFVDLYTPLFDENTGEIRTEYTSDGAHLTHAGYEVVSGKIRPILSTLLDDWV